MDLRYATLLLLALLAGPVHAGGINLSWNDCGTFGQPLATFACNTNTGVNRLYASFVSPVPLTQMVGMELRMDVMYNQATVPSWWTVQWSGGCRFGSLNGNVDFLAGPNSCADPWAGAAFVGLAAQPGVPFPNRMLVRAVVAVPQALAFAVDDVTEHYAIELILGHQKTVGTGWCAGCDVAACLLLTELKLVQPLGVGDYSITQPLSNTIVGWQCPAFNGAPSPQCFSCPVPTKGKSWGAIKGLYR